MERLNALGRGAQMMLVGGVLLLISTFFDWQAVDDFPGVNAWNNVLGVLMGLATVILVAWLIAQIVGVDLPSQFQPAMMAALLGGVILVLAVLKNLTDDYSTFWSYLGVVLAALIALGAYQMVQAAGGMETLKAQLPQTGSTAADAPAAPAAPPPPAPAAPEAPSVPDAAPEAPAAAPDTAPDADPPADRGA